jgi:hypothetical protein
MATTFADIQNMLDAILINSNWAQSLQPPPTPQQPPPSPPPHGVFWRQTGKYDQDYTLFTTGNVPNVDPAIPIMNTTPGQELTSNFYVVLTNPNGLPGIEQMPGGPGGPYLTDAGYQVSVNGAPMTGPQIQAALASWLKNRFPK